MKKFFFVLVLSIFIKSINSNLFCPNKSNPPKAIEIDKSFTITAQMSGKNYSTVIINNKVFFKDTPKIAYRLSNYPDSSYCATNFVIPTKNDFQSLISSLGNKAFSTLTNQNGFNLTQYKYFLTKNKTDSGNFYLIYLDGNSVKVKDFNLKDIPLANISINCILSTKKKLILYMKEILAN